MGAKERFGRYGIGTKYWIDAGSFAIPTQATEVREVWEVRGTTISRRTRPSSPGAANSRQPATAIVGTGRSEPEILFLERAFIITGIGCNLGRQ